jgi:hypothetical protein
VAVAPEPVKEDLFDDKFWKVYQKQWRPSTTLVEKNEEQSRH